MDKQSDQLHFKIQSNSVTVYWNFWKQQNNVRYNYENVCVWNCILGPLCIMFKRVFVTVFDDRIDSSEEEQFVLVVQHRKIEINWLDTCLCVIVIKLISIIWEGSPSLCPGREFAFVWQWFYLKLHFGACIWKNKTV